jgi:hypothetical protein
VRRDGTSVGSLDVTEEERSRGGDEHRLPFPRARCSHLHKVRDRWKELYENHARVIKSVIDAPAFLDNTTRGAVANLCARGNGLIRNTITWYKPTQSAYDPYEILWS